MKETLHRGIPAWQKPRLILTQPESPRHKRFQPVSMAYEPETMREKKQKKQGVASLRAP
jgi:hypothetical protein